MSLLSRLRVYVLVIVNALVFSACVSATPPPSCNLANMPLELTDLPSGMVFDSEGSPIVDSTEYSIRRSFSSTTLRLGQAVYWYPQTQYAQRKYKEESDFSVGWPSAIEIAQPVVNLDGLSADEHILDCGSVSDGPACEFVARYGPVVTWFNIQFPGGQIQSDLIRDLAFRAENRLAKCGTGE